MITINKIFSILSPTWFIADHIKKRNDRKSTIVYLNNVYLIISLVSLFTLIIFEGKYLLFNDKNIFLYNEINIYFIIVWFYYLFSRSNEVFYAFLRDAIDKLNNINKSGLDYSTRIKLSLKSYLELVINFGILYHLIPEYLWVSAPCLWYYKNIENGS